MKLTLLFDMDGTLCDTYGIPNWLEKLRAYDESPYREAAPLVNMEKLAALLPVLRDKGITTRVVSWLSKESTPAYDEKIRAAKREWLREQGITFDSVRLRPYGEEKAYFRDKEGITILFDDNAIVRERFETFPFCFAIDPTKTDIVSVLEDLVG